MSSDLSSLRFSGLSPVVAMRWRLFAPLPPYIFTYLSLEDAIFGCNLLRSLDLRQNKTLMTEVMTLRRKGLQLATYTGPLSSLRKTHLRFD